VYTCSHPAPPTCGPSDTCPMNSSKLCLCVRVCLCLCVCLSVCLCGLWCVSFLCNECFFSVVLVFFVAMTLSSPSSTPFLSVPIPDPHLPTPQKREFKKNWKRPPRCVCHPATHGVCDTKFLCSSTSLLFIIPPFFIML
jgi:hypothetical protein